MPWSATDAKTHNKRATGKLGTLWARVANDTLRRTKNEGRAIREANAAVEGVHKARTFLLGDQKE